MVNNRVLFSAAFILFLLLTGLPAIADKTSEEKALEASNAWLTLIDTGHYTESWKTAADFFKNAVTQDQWSHSLNALRGPLGKVIKRDVKSKHYTTSLPGAPDGAYVVIQYKTVFENKKSAIETVTPMLDKTGKWRVSGYYIK